MKMLTLHYHEWMGKFSEHEGTKYWMVNNYILDKLLDKVKANNRHCKTWWYWDFYWYKW